MRASVDVPRGTSLLRAAGASVATVLTGVLLWGEIVHARAAHRACALGIPRSSGHGIVVALGFQDAGPRANLVNRWRARIALRTAETYAPSAESVAIVCSGGAVHGEVSEAELLRDHIVDQLQWSGPVQVETESKSTWENIRNVLPLLESADWIAIASNGLHAEKARAYLRVQRPDLADRLVPALDYRLGEMILVKPLFAVVGLAKLRTRRRKPATATPSGTHTGPSGSAARCST